MKKHLLISSLMGLFLAAMPAMGQSATAGDVTGSLTDSTGAAIPGAQVKLSNAGTGEVKTVNSDAQGVYRFSLLPPGNYKVSATAAGFATTENTVSVTIGTVTQDNLKLAVGQQGTTIEVSASQIPLIDTDNAANITTISESQIQNLPMPGGDVTTVAFTLPGIVVNNGGSYGNFSSNGLPGISNLFVLNGFDNEDPFLNLNNSGSSNLTLGQGELQEASVVQNGYGAQFGRAAGAIVFYTTKSGTNRFHGLVDYFGNTSVMNSNTWFGNHLGASRPHSVANQWTANVGGPIIKDKLFFFADYEGLRYVLPGFAGVVNFPSPQYQAYALANVPADAVSLYNQAFAAYQSSALYKSATPVTNGSGQLQDGTIDVNAQTGLPNGQVGNLGCGDPAAGGLTGTAAPGGGTFGVPGGVPCINAGYTTANNINKEWLFTFRGDYILNDHNRIYARFKVDHGSQPTSTSPINPLFSTTSIQPEDEGQMNWTDQITSHMTNSLTIAGNWYSAYFGPTNPTASSGAYPDNLYSDIGADESGTNGAAGLASIGVPYYLTQGRDVTQYQVVDDWTYIHGRNTWKAGFNYRRDDVTDYDQQVETVYPVAQFGGLVDYAAGNFNANSPFYATQDIFQQAYTNVQHAYVALYNIGVYAQNELQATDKLKLTLGVRVDRTGNPLCTNNCFSNYQSGAFPQGIASSDTTGGFNSPYNKSSGGPINNTESHIFPSIPDATVQGRVGFNWLAHPNTEVRGGFGMFADLPPNIIVDGSIQNFPNYNAVTVFASGDYAAGTGAGTVRNDANVGNAALQSGFKAGQSVTQINNVLSAQNIPFTPPSLGAYFPGEFKTPEYLEYSFQVQQQFGRSDSLSIAYAGNHGYNLLLQNPYINPSSGQYNNATGTWTLANGYEIGGYGATPPDPRFSKVTATTNNGYSNYNGLQVGFKHEGNGITAQLSYTWSHALDTSSNGGIGASEPWNAVSVTSQLTPNLKGQNLNYASADQDIRNNVAADFLYEERYKSTNFFKDLALGGWVTSFKTYWHDGQDFSINNNLGLGGFFNLGNTLMPDALTPNLTDTCHNGRSAAEGTSCLNAAQYNQGTQTDFGNVRRNAFRGSGYVDTDLSLQKTLFHHNQIRFLVAGNAYNLWNHPNFALPGTELGTSTFGVVTSTAAPPTSPYGSFSALGSARLIQVHGKLTF